ncbi:helix-turn-helix transcriptional regulator [Rhizobium leguminosarum]|uniref:helix-turn-helix domain-containing protein n=1 Tax=Rhizobium leguminosarum TaxID=384 RepID=UPI001C916778|nr:helix-turn-helix transcriptional regulator [Rhizobium leguminosarum]MBY3175630.1 helix-turn-helix transcriptional regulator [Rhizobium leguminosarum]
MSITVGQCRAARGLIGWSQAKLSEASRVSPATVANFESGKRVPIANNLAAIRSALQDAGIIFIDENGEGPGVRLRKER